MKKKILLLIPFLFLSLIFTGCGKKQEIIEETKEQLGNIDNLKIINSTRIEDNQVVFILKNKDNYVIKDVLVTIEFWNKAEEENKEDKLVTYSQTTFTIIDSKQSVAGMISPGRKEYDYYKIFLEIQEDSKTAKKKDVKDKFILEDKTTLIIPKKCTELTEEEQNNKIKCLKEDDEIPEISDKIYITLKNANDVVVNYYDIGVVFYKENKIVGFSNGNGTNLKSKKLRDIEIYFPKNVLTKKDIEFDDYTIYKNLVYNKES